MKNLFALILALVLCFALVSCGEDTKKAKDKNTVTEKITTETATDTTAKEETAKVTETETEEVKVSPEAESLKALVPGEWIPSTAAVGKEFTDSIILNEDGTASIGEKIYTWTIDYANSFSVEVLIKDGDTSLYKAYLYKGDGGTSYISLSKINAGSASASIGSFYKASEYTKLDITVDNWEDYFEFKEISTVERDAFGDLCAVRVQRLLMLKEEYGKVRSELSSCAIEYSYKSDAVTITTDVNTGEYTYGGVSIEYDSDPSTTIRTMEMLGRYSDEAEYDGRFGTRTASFSIGEFPTTDVWGYEVGFTILRIDGNIYTYTPAK